MKSVSLALAVLFLPFQVRAADQGVAAELGYLKDIAGDKVIGTPAALSEALGAFIDRNPGTELTEEAEEELAAVFKKQGDYKSAMVILLRLVYQRPDSKRAVKAQSELLEIGNKLLSSKLRSALGGIIKGAEAKEREERLAVLLQRIVDELGEALYEPTVQEFRRFQSRFPEYPKLDAIQWSMAQLHKKALKYPEAVIALNMLMKRYPDSEYNPKALLALGEIYVDGLREYKKGTDVYQELVEKFPKDPQALPALQKSSLLFSDYLKQYELSVQMDEKIVATWPKTEDAFKAYQHQALLYHDYLRQPRAAVKIYQRIAAEYPEPQAVAALQTAAQIARKDLKDYELEIEMRSKIGNDFPESKVAPEELYAVAQIYESDLRDIARAIRAYRDVSSKFIDSKYGDKARDRVNKLR